MKDIKSTLAFAPPDATSEYQITTIKTQVYQAKRLTKMLSLLTITSLLLLPISSFAAPAATTCPPNLNTAGINLVKEFEGWRASPYKDPVGKWTVAYGHLCNQDKKCSELGYKFPMTKTQGQSLLQKDLKVPYIPLMSNQTGLRVC